MSQLTPNQNLLGVRTTLVLEMCQTLFFPAPTQKEKNSGLAMREYVLVLVKGRNTTYN